MNTSLAYPSVAKKFFDASNISRISLLADTTYTVAFLLGYYVFSQDIVIEMLKKWRFVSTLVAVVSGVYFIYRAYGIYYGHSSLLSTWYANLFTYCMILAIFGMFAVILCDSGIWKALSFLLIVIVAVALGYKNFSVERTGNEQYECTQCKYIYNPKFGNEKALERSQLAVGRTYLTFQESMYKASKHKKDSKNYDIIHYYQLGKDTGKGYTINVLDLAKKLGYDDPGSMDNTMFSDGRNEFVKFSSYDNEKVFYVNLRTHKATKPNQQKSVNTTNLLNLTAISFQRIIFL